MMQLKSSSLLPSPSAQTRVVFVCHDHSTVNEQEPYQGSSSASVLTQQGWQAAEQTGKALKTLKFDAVYISPSERVQETIVAMQQAGSLHQVPIYSERADQFWHRILPRHSGHTLLIVAQGDTNQALLSSAIGFEPKHHRNLQQSNYGISIVDFPDTGRPQLRSLNSTYHLNESLPKLQEGKQGLRLLLLPLDPDIDCPTALIQQLTLQLQFTTIDLSISTKFIQAKQAISKVLCRHPKTLRLEMIKANFLQGWHQTFAQRNVDSDQLITALAVADIYQVQHLLANAIGLSADHIQMLHLEPGNLNILHYSASCRLPILQSLNFNSSPLISSVQEICS